jgi:Ca2+-transporting ATPase
MILTDDNFATIVAAVEYGRAIYDNLAKYIRFQMACLVAFILSYLGAAFWVILGGVPFSTLVVLFINFFIQVPIAIALGFDEPRPGLMERKPRPLSQPVLSRSQWARIIFLGLLVAIGTLGVETLYEQAGAGVAATMGFVTFSLLNIVLGLSARDEFDTVFSREIMSDRRQLQLYGLALLFVILATELGFMQRLLGLVSLNGNQWLTTIILAIVLLLVDEVIKFFLRRRHKHETPAASGAPVSLTPSGAAAGH